MVDPPTPSQREFAQHYGYKYQEAIPASSFPNCVVRQENEGQYCVYVPPGFSFPGSWGFDIYTYELTWQTWSGASRPVSADFASWYPSEIPQLLNPRCRDISNLNEQPTIEYNLTEGRFKMDEPQYDLSEPNPSEVDPLEEEQLSTPDDTDILLSASSESEDSEPSEDTDTAQSRTNTGRKKRDGSLASKETGEDKSRSKTRKGKSESIESRTPAYRRVREACIELRKPLDANIDTF
jgi:hypothetical protein